MQVCGNSRSYVCDFKYACHAITVERIDQPSQGEREQCEKPPALPNRWQDTERKSGRRETEASLQIHCAHEKPISPRSEVSVVDTALFTGQAPVLICPFQPVFIPQLLAGTEVQSHKINIQLILVRTKLKWRH